MTARKKKEDKQMSFGFDLDSQMQKGIKNKKGSTSKKKTSKASTSKKKQTLSKKKTKDMDVNTSSQTPRPSAKKKRSRKNVAATAESMAAKQRDISVSEFFAKNRHLLGFDNPSKALLTAVKEAVDNSLDACEEAHILPDIEVGIKQRLESRYVLWVQGNGAGVVEEQVPNSFG
ncbi:MAG: hypothetical protein H8E62_00640, partial [Planctomycetes bacterium]|nr:hypothetical protein [Planctomycetota bacterium]